MKRISKLIIALGIIAIIAPMLTNMYAAKSLNDIIEKANGFFGNYIKNPEGNALFKFTGVFELLTEIVFGIGNLVIICSAVIMGLRYVWSGVSEKASIKESAINMSVGVVFFYMAKGITDFAFDAAGGIFTLSSFDSMQNGIWGMVAYAVKIFAVIGLAATGIKYMMESADTKADLKKKLFPVIIGLVIIFCLTDVINFIINASEDILGVDDSYDVEVPTETIIAGNRKFIKAISNIWGTAKVIIQIAAVSIMVFTGIRYMFSSADNRADIKKQTVILLAGAAIVFGASEIITFVTNAGKDILQ